MNTTENIEVSINKFPKGYVFTYNDLSFDISKKEAVIKRLNRLVSKGKLSKLSKGKYYKPESTSFGELAPVQQQIVKDLLEE